MTNEDVEKIRDFLSAQIITSVASNEFTAEQSFWMAKGIWYARKSFDEYGLR